MIHIRASREDGGLQLRLRGHAGTAPKGEDLVCAAVTALVYALAQYVLDNGGQAALESGAADIRIHTVTKETQGAFTAILTGLHLLAREYPQSITIRDQ